MSLLTSFLRLTAKQSVFRSSAVLSRAVHAQQDKGGPLVDCELHHDDKIGVLTLNDPTKLNAITVTMGESLIEKVEFLKSVPDLRAVILTGKGKAFSAGGDLNWLLERHLDTFDNNKKTMLKFYSRLLTLRSLEVPIIGALRGPAIGAGACLAIAGCDIRVAEPSTKMAFNFLKIGLHPGMGGTHFLPELVGPAVAADLLLTGRTIDAQEALHLKIISKICDNAIIEAFGIASDIVSNGPQAVKACLVTLRRRQEAGNVDLDDALAREAEAQALTYATEDLCEGVLAIKQKRKPSFTGN